MSIGTKYAEQQSGRATRTNQDVRSPGTLSEASTIRRPGQDIQTAQQRGRRKLPQRAERTSEAKASTTGLDSPPDRQASKPKQVVSPFQKVRLTNKGNTDIAGDETNSNEEGFNRDERDFPTMQIACDNAIKRLKLVVAYSAYWMPAELAHKLQELFIQF